MAQPTGRFRRVVNNPDEVRSWQQFLKDHGIDPGPVDGDFGPQTKRATQQFQRLNGLKDTGGAVGDETKAARDVWLSAGAPEGGPAARPTPGSVTVDPWGGAKPPRGVENVPSLITEFAHPTPKSVKTTTIKGVPLVEPDVPDVPGLPPRPPAWTVPPKPTLTPMGGTDVLGGFKTGVPVGSPPPTPRLRPGDEQSQSAQNELVLPVGQVSGLLGVRGPGAGPQSDLMTNVTPSLHALTPQDLRADVELQNFKAPGEAKMNDPGQVLARRYGRVPYAELPEDAKQALVAKLGTRAESAYEAMRSGLPPVAGAAPAAPKVRGELSFAPVDEAPPTSPADVAIKPKDESGGVSSAVAPAVLGGLISGLRGGVGVGLGLGGDVSAAARVAGVTPAKPVPASPPTGTSTGTASPTVSGPGVGALGALSGGAGSGPGMGAFNAGNFGANPSNIDQGALGAALAALTPQQQEQQVTSPETNTPVSNFGMFGSGV